MVTFTKCKKCLKCNSGFIFYKMYCFMLTKLIRNEKIVFNLLISIKK